MTSRYMDSNSLMRGHLPRRPASPPTKRERRRDARGVRNRSPSREQLRRLVDARDEAVDFLTERVEIEARPVGRGDPKLGHERLAAVVTRSDSDTFGVEHL